MSRLVYGLRPVEELLRARRPVSLLYVLDGEVRGFEAVLKAAQLEKVAVERRAREELDALAGGKLHQGVVAVAGEYAYCEVDDLLGAAAERQEPPLVLVLDGVQDPQNLGALVRSAHILGAHGVVIPKDRAAGVTPAVVKASAGATEHTRIARVTNVARTLDELKEAGVWTVGAVAEGGDEPAGIDMRCAVAIVLGSEGRGLRSLVLRGCDLKVCIPMVGRVASLNVAAAGAVLLYEAQRQRRAPKS